ncbi:oxidoreductase [Lactococcus allomyrinae]|uniref:SDR family NAD(P)-dependent oxidoreductase n=1 Tax=Lactococcus allomyrinae TaxID=2419773 RepID=A0A387BEJ7_9LACT|nr:oxidoreductase [Lactococcus allomyrinae]AYG00019.1 SDR family NAD(P)-dependent oxidoreductase [Lactococcus allomyrinae]
MKNNDKVWLVTGASTGFGRALVEELIVRNYKVVATARQLSALTDLSDGENVLKTRLDVTDKASISAAVAATIEKFGRIDVLVNNAGFGYFGVMEESDQAAVRRMMDTNFWGANDMTLAVLPYMRKQKSGRILNTVSRGGLTTTETLAYYHATKFAMEGLFQTLRKEVEPLGIFVTNIEPGSFRTDWAGRSKESSPAEITDYAAAHKTLDRLNSYSGTQAGSPALAAKAFIKVAELDNPPMHYLMGKGAYQLTKQVFEAALDEFETYKEDAQHLDFGDEAYWKQ